MKIKVDLLELFYLSKKVIQNLEDLVYNDIADFNSRQINRIEELIKYQQTTITGKFLEWLTISESVEVLKSRHNQYKTVDKNSHDYQVVYYHEFFCKSEEKTRALKICKSIIHLANNDSMPDCVVEIDVVSLSIIKKLANKEKIEW